jgi:hypothetical protein
VRQCSSQEDNTSMLSKCVVHKARRAAVLEAQGHHKARHAAVLECSGHSQVGKRGAGPADSTSGPWMIDETGKRGACRADSASEPWKLNETGKRGASQAGSASGPSKKDDTKHAKRQCSRQEFNTSMRSKCVIQQKPRWPRATVGGTGRWPLTWRAEARLPA